MPQLIVRLLVVLVSIGCCGQLSAQPMMIVATGNGGELSTLYEVNPVTGATVRTIGAVGYALSDLAWDSTTSTLYGATAYRDPSGYQGLVKIDLSTGRGSREGFVDGWGFNKDSFSGGDYPNVALTANSSGDLYGLDNFGAVGMGDPQYPGEGLNAVDKATGVVTEIGNAFFVNRDGLAFDPDDTLYLIHSGSIHTVDQSTGEKTLVSEIVIDFVTVNGEFNPLDGFYYGAEFNGRRVGIINVENGDFSSITTDLSSVQAVEFIDLNGPVDLTGRVETGEGVGVCAMVLASGQYMFSCGPSGPYALTQLPRETNGTVTRQIYADGFFPEVDVLAGSTRETVVMTPARNCPNYNLPYDPDTLPGSAGKRHSISGRVVLQSTDTPVCAMVLANGNNMFSCDGSGSYALEFPLDSDGRFTLQVYASGFAPSVQHFDEFSVGGDVRMARSTECQ